MWLLRSISLPHLRRHGVRTMLTLVGIATGVAAVVATTTVTDSVFRSFRHMIDVTAGRAQLHVSNGGGGVRESLLEPIRATPGVATATPLVQGFVSLPDAGGDSLAIFGLDLLGDREHEAQVPRSAIEIPDDVVFVSRTDSVALARGFAETMALDIDGTFDVQGPAGRRRMVVRGLVEPVGPASLFGGRVALMDLPAAQRLLARDQRLDRIDVRVADGVAQESVAAALRTLVGSEGRVEDTTAAGARAEDLLLSVRVFLSLASFIAALVGFFVIYHTVRVSILQRRHDLAVLSAFGVSPLGTLSWLSMEALILGGIASSAGAAGGGWLARAAAGSLGHVASAWIEIPVRPVSMSPMGVLLGLGVGLLTSLVATLAGAWSVTSRLIADHLRPGASAASEDRGGWNTIRASGAAFALTAIMLVGAPRTMSFTWLVCFVFVVNCLALCAFALLSPVLARVLGRLVHRVGGLRPGLAALVAGASVERAPAAPSAVVAAVVMGLAWNLSAISLITSTEESWLHWLDEHYRSDFVITGSSAVVSLLTYPPIAEDIVRDIRTTPGVTEVQGLRTIEVPVRDRPTIVMALDEATHGLPLVDGDWAHIASGFWAGSGAVISDNLAHRLGGTAGATISVPSPTGMLTFPVLGIFSDFQNGGDLGCIAIARTLYTASFGDTLVNRIRVWASPDGDIEALRAHLQRRYGPSHGLHVLTHAEARTGVSNLVRSTFGVGYALVIIALVVSAIGVVNFLLADVLGRLPEIRVLDALGVTPAQIGATVIVQGAVIGCVGAVLGLAAGIVQSWIIIRHSVPMVNGWHFTWHLPPAQALALAAAVVLLSAAAGVIPARVAIRKRREVRVVAE